MIEEEERFDMAIIDADSILYQIAHTTTSEALCKKYTDRKIEEIMEATSAKAGVVLVKGQNNFRFAADLEYKGNRKDTIDPDVRERINMLYEHVEDIAMQGDNGEADDYCAIIAQTCRDNNQTYIICHIDKDLNCIPSYHYNFKTGTTGLWTPEESYRFMFKQFLTGDAADNIKGIKGLGPVTANKIVDNAQVDRLWDTVVSTWQEKQGAIWKDNFVKCVNCIYIRQYEADLRVLTFEELKEKLAWKTMATGLLSLSDRPELSDSSTQSSGQPEDSTSEESN